MKLIDGSHFFVNYAGTNGREYQSIGKLLIEEEKIRREDMSMQVIRKWLDDNPSHLKRVLFYNPSYVFFRVMDEGPFGSTGAKLTPGRSAAFDPRFIPKGAIAHITFDMPLTKGGTVDFSKTSRFVFNQDQGGAIKGAGRMDLFLGFGAIAAAKAGVMKNPGKVAFLVLNDVTYAGEGVEGN